MKMLEIGGIMWWSHYRAVLIAWSLVVELERLMIYRLPLTIKVVVLRALHQHVVHDLLLLGTVEDLRVTLSLI